MSDLQHWLERIERLHPSEIELGLERLRRVAGDLGVRTLPMPVITVAGTNGKGSVVRLLTAMAEAAGLRCCVYTSPHLLRFNERVRLPDGPASDQALCQAFAAVEQGRGDTALTYFEFTTLAGLWLFQRSDADLCILEVGLGGRLDAVNLIDADVAVVTSVGLDHLDWLGDSREAILREKIGIGRAGRPLVYGELAAPSNLDSELAALAALPLRAGREFTLGDGEVTVRDGDEERRYRIPEPARLGDDNLATAVQALAAAGLAPAPHIPGQVVDTGLTGRCDRRRFKGIDCILDVGHNLEALTRLRHRLPACAGRRRLVLGMMADKPVEQVVALFAGEPLEWYPCRPDLPRAATVERLVAALPETVRKAAVHPCGSVAEALEAAVNDSDTGDQVVIVGSFYTVAEALTVIEAVPPPAR
ncbi:bifunctional folylpolyglutamate synthase/dihydrofolate synthase [Alloalcanivorax xenomutans]|uniref:bifunctional folylpolyglutamate synthase/dihydrofolate synthase n=1 Tax=Alloalcanivorax xenomutans TaxID=1094342 RepID=UPI0009B6C42A|nr:Mur ligase family protein [Alloalcanivorax xenomutans]ARB46156.1 folylpolyglutamate synthase [Alloalcanivorax xenomutans]